ncbi:MAG TPA: DUF6787 family protein [Flavobacterium sp.]
MEKLKKRWGITSNYDLVIIFIVFAINGSLSAKISGYAMDYLGLNKDNMHWFFYYLILLVLVLPLYPFLLMVFGYLFGQSKFFFPFSKKMLKSIGLGFFFKEEKK